LRVVGRAGVSGPATATEATGSSATILLTAAPNATLGWRDVEVRASAEGVEPVTALVRVEVVAAPVEPYVITESAFAAGDWEIFQAASTGGATHTAESRAADGNPGAHRFMRHQMPISSSVNVRHRFVGAGGVLDNAARGARIDRIDVRMDRRVSFATAGSGGAVGHAFLLFQNGVIFWADLGPFNSTAWETRERVGLRASDFVNSSGNNPDFSASGAPVSFGYLRSNSNTSTQVPIELQHAIDNWRVVVHLVAE
jgi:hypothetical protein